MIALAIAASLSFGGGCVEGLCTPAALDPWFAKLARVSGPGPRTGKPLHILQIGDSHSAGDAITGAWRDVLQARYGGGGRGVLPPGRPFDGYITQGVTVSMSPGWSIAADFGKAWASTNPPLGLSAFSLTAQAAGATMALDADAVERFTRVVICALARPGAGSLTISAGGTDERIDLDSNTARPLCRTIQTDGPQTHVDLASEGGPVTITSWGTFNDAGGIALSNLGVVGSQLVHFARTDDAVLAEELRAYDPDLIVLAFGTNEGFAPRVSAFEYEIILRTQIGRIRRLAGNVPILLLGAPDALTRRADLLANAPDGDSAPCVEGAVAQVATAPPAATMAGGLGQAMTKLGDFLGLTAREEGGQPVVAAPPATIVVPAGGGKGPLFPPAGLSVIRDVQRRVAASLHVAFWDWQARMGGRCTAMRWARATPPLMRGDYVHYTKAGGREIAQRLEADLEKAAAR